eukprot:6212820-Pleurochrysis_carterae.AAC.4
MHKRDHPKALTWLWQSLRTIRVQEWCKVERGGNAVNAQASALARAPFYPFRHTQAHKVLPLPAYASK